MKPSPKLKPNIQFETERFNGDKLVLIKNFLTDEECEIILSQDIHLKTAMVYRHDGVEEQQEFHRKCLSASFDLDWLDTKLETIIDWPIQYAEKFQMMKYGVGDFFKPHSDYIDHLKEHNRIATLIMYLNTPKKGGETIFPIDRVKVSANKGDAVFFDYSKERKVLHAGCRVVEGEKIILTKWFREEGYSKT